MTTQRNTAYLYGDIRSVFDGCIEPAKILNKDHFVDRQMRFGLGVCSFSDDVADIADSCFVDGRFFVKQTAEGLERAGDSVSRFGLKQRVLDGRAHRAEVEYVAPYSIGMSGLADYDWNFWWGSDTLRANAELQPTMQDMLISFTGGIGVESSLGNAPMERLVGFVGICEFDAWWGTSLRHAPIEGRNILQDIDYFARPGRNYGPRMGVVVGFAQRVLVDDPDWGDRELLERMFFENPHDRAKGGARATERSTNVFRIASHTHGVLVDEGENLFSLPDTKALPRVSGNRSWSDNEACLERLRTDDELRNRFIEQTFQRDFTDSSHVIPDSILRRYMFMQFDVENVVVRGPYDNGLTLDLDGRKLPVGQA
jgi:hypothetical protein